MKGRRVLDLLPFITTPFLYPSLATSFEEGCQSADNDANGNGQSKNVLDDGGAGVSAGDQ